jgi:hypothetical protein
MLHKDYDRKGSVAKEIYGCDPKGAWRQEEPIGCKTESQSESYVTTDDMSVSLPANKAPIWGLRPDF